MAQQHQAVNRKQMQEEVEEAWSKEQKELPPEQRLNSAFENISILDFPDIFKSQVVEVRSDASIHHAVEILAKYNLLSVPVVDVDAAADASWIDRYLGLVEAAGIAVWVLSKSELAGAGIIAAASATGAATGALIGAVGALALGAATAVASVGGATAGGVAVTGNNGTQGASSVGGDFFTDLTQSQCYAETQVKDVVGSFRWAPFLPVQPSDSLLTLLLLLSKYQMKSLPVVQPGERDITQLITQKAVIHVLSHCTGFSWFDRVGKKLLHELSLPAMKPDQVVKVREDEPVLEAFKRMAERGIGGIPVIPAQGGNKLLGNISMGDLLLLLTSPEVFQSYRSLTVANFLEGARAHLQEQGSQAPFTKPLVTCSGRETLNEVIRKLNYASIHRIYVVDDDIGDVLGVVTLRDIISKFVEEPAGYFGDFFQEIVPQKEA